jgi:hypothetical protein
MHAPLTDKPHKGSTRRWLDPAVRPAPELQCEVQVVDREGKYVLPFPVSWAGGGWVNARHGDRIEVRVLGWRRWPIEGR